MKSLMRQAVAVVLNLCVVIHPALGDPLRVDQGDSHWRITGDDDHHHHHHHDIWNDPQPLGLSLTDSWLAPWPHTHFSRQGTPFVHGFGLEPAYLDRDLFLHFAFHREKDEVEFETEIELEWALTRRLGVVVEAPFIQSNPDVGDTDSGFGDMAIAPRALLYEGEKFLLSANFEISLPTGDESRGFGGEEVGLAPSISTWLDLSHRTALMTQIGYEAGTESGDSEIFYSAAVTHSLRAGTRSTKHDCQHFPAGMVNLTLEFSGRTGLHGEEDGESSVDLLFGSSILLSPSWELRGAYQFPVVGDTDFEDAVIFGMIYHF